MDDTKLYHDGIEEAKAGQMFTANVLVIGLVGSGAYLMTPFGWLGWPVLSIFYIGASIATLTFVLRKHLCTHCWYYGKRCHCGWGKLSALLYKSQVGNYKFGKRLASFTWAGIMLVPLVSYVLGLFLNHFHFFESWPVLTIFCVLLAGNVGLHKKSCSSCKMRSICSGSVSKQR